jgi:hypothetical protein
MQPSRLPSSSFLWLTAKSDARAEMRHEHALVGGDQQPVAIGPIDCQAMDMGSSKQRCEGYGLPGRKLAGTDHDQRQDKGAQESSSHRAIRRCRPAWGTAQNALPIA